MNLVIGGTTIPVAIVSGAVAFLIFLLSAAGRAVDRNAPRQIVSSIKNAQDAAARTEDPARLTLLESLIAKEFARLERRRFLLYRALNTVSSAVMYAGGGVVIVDNISTSWAQGRLAGTELSAIGATVFFVALIARLVVLFFEERKLAAERYETD